MRPASNSQASWRAAGLVRRAVGLVATATSLAAALTVACSGGDPGAPGVAADGGEGGPSGDPQTQGDAGFSTGADAGCALKFQGPRSGTVAASVPRDGATGVAWDDPAAALTVDGMLARAVLDVGQRSERLRVTGYGFALPASATLHGVVVELKRQGNGPIADGSIALWLDGHSSTRPKYFEGTWPIPLGTHHYGQEVDTWGDDLGPDLVARAGFGVEIDALRQPDAGTGPATAAIESLLITIWYCE